MDAATCSRLPCWTGTPLVSADNAADGRVLTLTSVHLDRRAFNHELSRQIHCPRDGDYGTFGTRARNALTHRCAAAIVPRRHALDPVRRMCFWTAITMGCLLLFWPYDFGRGLNVSNHVPINLDILVFHIYGHLCYVTVSSKARSPATWFVS
jgi:hypothetical protein